MNDRIRQAVGGHPRPSVDGGGLDETHLSQDGVLAALSGRIYNGARLRTLLGERGHELSGETDAELLAHLYQEFGSDLVHALDGRFALAVWDQPADRLLLARDRFGEETLFFSERGGALTFASRPSRLLGEAPPRLDPAVLSEYLERGRVPAARSIASGCRQLPPGCSICWRPGERVAPRPYWRLPDASDPGGESEEELLAEFGRLLSRSLRDRLELEPRPAVVFGTGAGAALLAVLAGRESGAPVRTIAAGLGPDGAAAADLAREIGAEHRELSVADEALAAAALDLLARAPQPLGDPAALPLPLLACAASGEVGAAIGPAGAAALFGAPGAPDPRSDPAATQAALEVRSPFLEFQLAEFAVTVPPSLRSGGALPRKLTSTRSPLAPLDRALPIPAAAWLRGPLAGALEAQVDAGPLVEGGWIDRESTGIALRRHLGGEEDRTAELWPVLALGRWIEGFGGRDGD